MRQDLRGRSVLVSSVMPMYLFAGSLRGEVHAARDSQPSRRGHGGNLCFHEARHDLLKGCKKKKKKGPEQ